METANRLAASWSAFMNLRGSGTVECCPSDEIVESEKRVVNGVVRAEGG